MENIENDNFRKSNVSKDKIKLFFCEKSFLEFLLISQPKMGESTFYHLVLGHIFQRRWSPKRVFSWANQLFRLGVSTDSKNIKISSGNPWEVLPIEGPFSPQKSQKYMGNGHNCSINFVLAITFNPMHLFQFRFHCWSTFILMFAKKSLLTISVAILGQAIMAKLAKMTILVVIAWLNMATDMVKSDFFVNRRIKVDQQWKRN